MCMSRSGNKGGRATELRRLVEAMAEFEHPLLRRSSAIGRALPTRLNVHSVAQ